MTGHVGLAMPPPQHPLVAIVALLSPKPHIHFLISPLAFLLQIKISLLGYEIIRYYSLMLVFYL